jgi:enamine deaminase RidA (YjgF/YER057c/UK114 family)
MTANRAKATVAGEPRSILPDGWPRPSGYSNGIVATGRMLFVAGQVGWDPVTSTIVSDDFAAQTETALDNVLAVLKAGGARAEHVVRMTWFVTDLDAYREARGALGRAFRARFGSHYPAMSVVQVAGLLEPGALVEIEATAVIPEDQ